MPTKKLKVWALYRVSTDRQGGEGEDIPMQRLQCHSFAESKGWTVENEITEKLSGFKTAIEDRDSLRVIKRGATQKEFDILLVYHSDRLGRQMEYSLWIASLYEQGVQVWSAKEGELKSDEHIDKFINFVRYWQAEGESLKTSMRVSDSMQELNEQGYYMGGTPPYGYMLEDTGEKRNSKSDKTLKKIVPCPEEARIVRLLFSLVLSKSMGGKVMAKYLNSELKLTNRGNVWRANTITRILRNPVYIGFKRYAVTKKVSAKSRKYKGVSREDWKLQPFNPALVIVDKDDFQEVQEILDRRMINKTKEKYIATYSNVPKGTPSSSMTLLSGMAFCGCCGGRFRSDYSIKYHNKKDGTKSKYKVARYVCSNAENVGLPHDGQKRMGAKSVDEQVEKAVLDVLSTIDIGELKKADLEKYKKKDTKHEKLAALEKEFNEAELAYKNTEGMFDKVMSGKIKMDINFISDKLEEYGTKKQKLSEELYQVKKEIEESEGKELDIDLLAEQLKNWVQEYKKLQVDQLDEKKSLLGKVLDSVILERDNIQINFNLSVSRVLSHSGGDGGGEGIHKEDGKPQFNKVGADEKNAALSFDVKRNNSIIDFRGGYEQPLEQGWAMPATRLNARLTVIRISMLPVRFRWHMQERIPVPANFSLFTNPSRIWTACILYLDK